MRYFFIIEGTTRLVVLYICPFRAPNNMFRALFFIYPLFSTERADIEKFASIVICFEIGFSWNLIFTNWKKFVLILNKLFHLLEI
jgi:hypothetical protein